MAIIDLVKKDDGHRRLGERGKWSAIDDEYWTA